MGVSAGTKIFFSPSLYFSVSVRLASGLAIWEPVQLRELTALFGGYDTARFVHFFTMAVIVVFLAIHVAMAIIVPKSLLAMIRGR